MPFTVFATIAVGCPFTSFASLKAAIHNGADAVYLSGKSFGARKFANNFSLEELKEAVSYAHLYGVKIYVQLIRLFMKMKLMIV